MRKSFVVAALFAAVGLSALAAPAHAQNATIYAVHGINGADIGLDMDLPVSVSVNGDCLVGLTDPFVYKEIAGPVGPLLPGEYEVEVFLGAGCSGLKVIQNTFYLAAFENASIVAHLTEEGVPVLTKFVNDLRPTDYHRVRGVVRHAAAAPPVNIWLKQYKPYRMFQIRNLGNGEQQAFEVRGGEYMAKINTIYGKRIAEAPLSLMDPKTVVIVYAVGSLKAGSFDLIPQTIPIPMP